MAHAEDTKVFNEIIQEETEATEANETEIAVEAEAVVAPDTVVAPKKTKKKRVLTDEEKERLKKNLAKGRATSLANRRKKAQLKKIEMEEKSKEEDERIFQAYKKKRKPAELEDENSSLKKQLADLKLELSAKKERPEIIKPVKVKEKKVKSAATTDSDDDKLIQVEETPKPPPPKKKMSNREIMKLMRGK
jgi:hypothetical protein